MILVTIIQYLDIEKLIIFLSKRFKFIFDIHSAYVGYDENNNLKQTNLQLKLQTRHASSLT